MYQQTTTMSLPCMLVTFVKLELLVSDILVPSAKVIEEYLFQCLFLTCCWLDFDLCQLCYKLGEHGHNPMHRFITHMPSSPKQVIPDERASSSSSSSSKRHPGIFCDRCDQNIVGVRYKVNMSENLH